MVLDEGRPVGQRAGLMDRIFTTDGRWVDQLGPGQRAITGDDLRALAFAGKLPADPLVTYLHAHWPEEAGVVSEDAPKPDTDRVPWVAVDREFTPGDPVPVRLSFSIRVF